MSGKIKAAQKAVQQVLETPAGWNKNLGTADVLSPSEFFAELLGGEDSYIYITGYYIIRFLCVPLLPLPPFAPLAPY